MSSTRRGREVSSSFFSAGKALLPRTTVFFFLVFFCKANAWIHPHPEASNAREEDISTFSQEAFGPPEIHSHLHQNTRSLLQSPSPSPRQSRAAPPLGSPLPLDSSYPPDTLPGPRGSTFQAPGPDPPSLLSNSPFPSPPSPPLTTPPIPSPVPSSLAPAPGTFDPPPRRPPQSGCSDCKYSILKNSGCECAYHLNVIITFNDKQLLSLPASAIYDALSPPLTNMSEQIYINRINYNPYSITLDLVPRAPNVTFSPAEESLLRSKLDVESLKTQPLFSELSDVKIMTVNPPPPPPPSPPPPPPSPPPPAAPPPKKSDGGSGPSIVLIIGAGAGGLVTTLMVLITLCWCWQRKRKQSDEEEEEEFSKFEAWKAKGSMSHVSSRPSMGFFGGAGSDAGSDSHRRGPTSTQMFSYEELQAATNNWEMVLGEGGFGRVYHGRLTSGVEVAIKKLSTGGHQGDREFLAEIDMLSRLHHRHLVKLLGYYSNRDFTQQLLCYELIPNDSLEAHLHGHLSNKDRPLDWPTRLKIALGAAKGLAYLHEGATPCVIHRDFKASNILLENDFTAKVADFGLAKHAPEGGGRDYVSTRVMGTFGYVAPEYAMTGHLLVKSDVYSYGVVLLELLTGRKPVDMSRPPGQENLVTWARPLVKNEATRVDIADPNLDMSEVPPDTFIEAAVIADTCVNPEASNRPTMGQVVKQLNNIISRTESFLAARLSERALPSAMGSRMTSAEHSREPSGLQSLYDSPSMSQIFPPDWPEGLRAPPQGFGADGRKPLSRFKDTSNKGNLGGSGSPHSSQGRSLSDRTWDSSSGPWTAQPSTNYSDFEQYSKGAAMSEDLAEGR